MKLKEKRYTVHFDITKSLLDIDGVKLKKNVADSNSIAYCNRITYPCKITNLILIKFRQISRRNPLIRSLIREFL